MAFRYEVDTSQATAYFRDLSQMSGAPIQVVILHEIEKVLEECVRLTTRENFEKIKRSVEFKNRTLRFGDKGSGPAIIYITKSGVVWFADEPGAGNEGIAKGKKVSGKTFHPFTEFFRYSDKRWAKGQNFVEQLSGKRIVVRDVMGRAGQSWVQAGRAIGLEINAPAYVKNAPPFKGQTHVNGTGSKGLTTVGVFVEIRNAAPILLGTIDGNRILQRALNGRANYFWTNIKEGVMQEPKELARAYRGIFVA